MPLNENFICLTYSSVEFLIPKQDVVSALSCNDSNFLTNEKGERTIILSSKLLKYFDFDIFADSIGQAIRETNVKTCVVINCNNIFTDSKEIGIVTSAECKVKNIPLNSFSLFSSVYNTKLTEKGIIACKFKPITQATTVEAPDSAGLEKICYLIDIKKLLAKLQGGTK